MLCTDDLGKVFDCLSASSCRWLQLGLQLGVSPEELQKVDHQWKNPDKCLFETLMCWLKQTECAQPSLSALVTALKQESVGEKVLAQKLEQLDLGKCYRLCM